MEGILPEGMRILENQLAFMPCKLTTGLTSFMRQLLETFRVKERDLHIVLAEAQYAYDKLNSDELWKTFRKKSVPLGYVWIINDMHARSKNRVWNACGDTRKYTRGMSGLDPQLLPLFPSFIWVDWWYTR